MSLCTRHILVKSKFEAEDIQKLLKQGKAFTSLAQKFSQCSSASAGGDLGDVSKKLHLLDEDFRNALEALKIGDTSGIVRTRFGYHLIQRY
ncbi:MAG: peptidylprolyl isomerase [Pseudobdellovibrio sp.]